VRRLAFAAVLLAPLAARAEDQKLPFNPYEKAQKGDWCILTGTFKREGAGEGKMSCANFARVTNVEGDKVSVEEQSQVGAIEKAAKTFSTKETPTIASYFDLKGGTVENVAVADDKRKICDKDLACKKLTFSWKHDGANDEISAWLSPEVKCGLAAFTLKGSIKGKDKVELETQIKMECAGCGNGDKKDMGDAPDDLLDPDMLAAPEEACDLPFHPLAKAKKGDWCAIRMEANFGGQSEIAIANFEVTKVGKETIEVEMTSKRDGRGGGGETQKLSFDATKTPNAMVYLGLLIKGSTPSGDVPKVSNVKIVDDKKTVGDHEFACKRMSFSFSEHGSNIRVKMWLSPDVKGMGLVACEIKAKERGADISIDIELGGYGDEDKTEWGKTAEQLSKKKKKKKDDDE